MANKQPPGRKGTPGGLMTKAQIKTRKQERAAKQAEKKTLRKQMRRGH